MPGFVLITPNGQRHMFHIKACAEVFQSIFGGRVEEVKQGWSWD